MVQVLRRTETGAPVPRGRFAGALRGPTPRTRGGRLVLASLSPSSPLRGAECVAHGQPPAPDV